MSLASCQNYILAITAPRDRFCNPRLQELRVLTIENFKFDSKTSSGKLFTRSLTKALKAFPDLNPRPVTPTDEHAADSAVEQTLFHRDTARLEEVIHSAQEARSVQIRRRCVENMPGWIHAKLLEQLETISGMLMFFRTKAAVHSQPL